MSVEAKANPIQVSGSNQRCIPGSVRFFSIFFTLKTTRKVGGLQIRRCQGFAVAHYGFTLGALALKPSDFCNTGVYTAPNPSRRISESSPIKEKTLDGPPGTGP